MSAFPTKADIRRPIETAPNNGRSIIIILDYSLGLAQSLKEAQ